MWGPVTSSGTPVTVGVQWVENSADYESPPVTRSDTSVSFDHPAYVSMKPPKGSLASKWHGCNQSDEIFALTFPQGATVDLDFDFVLSDLGAPLGGPTIAGGTAGNFYHKIVNSLTPVMVNAL
jgi:hypothetical protein